LFVICNLFSPPSVIPACPATAVACPATAVTKAGICQFFLKRSESKKMASAEEAGYTFSSVLYLIPIKNDPVFI
jgi:hypothetical protein